MPRPYCRRRVSGEPFASTFGPEGLSEDGAGVISMTLDEFEAMRLAHNEGLYQQDASARMEVSRATFGRILESAHRKVTEALLDGRVLRIEGGSVRVVGPRRFRCATCAHVWEMSQRAPRPFRCPCCRKGRVDRTEGEEGGGEVPDGCDCPHCSREEKS